METRLDTQHEKIKNCQVRDETLPRVKSHLAKRGRLGNIVIYTDNAVMTRRRLAESFLN